MLLDSYKKIIEIKVLTNVDLCFTVKLIMHEIRDKQLPRENQTV